MKTNFRLSSHLNELALILSILTILLLVGFFRFGGWTKKDETQKILSSQGFTDVEITGFRFLGCDEKDFFHTGFVATSPNGQRIKGVVCAGWFKGSTIRFD